MAKMSPIENILGSKNVVYRVLKCVLKMLKSAEIAIQCDFVIEKFLGDDKKVNGGSL